MAMDWTTNAAKWAAVFALGGISSAGVVWSLVDRTEPAVIVRGGTLPARPEAVPETPRVEVSPPAPMAQKGATAGVLPSPEPAPVATEPPPAPRAPSASLAQKININTATAAELELLPGVGEAIAARIVEHRQRIGGFRSVEQLDDVKGIGPTVLGKLRPLVRVE